MLVKQFMIGLLCLLIAGGTAGAAIFQFADGVFAGSAEFAVVGDNLVITLVNTSPFNTSIPDEVLTAVFFDLSGSPTLTPVSGVLAPGSVVIFGTTPLDGVIGGEWAYSGSTAPLAPGGTNYGVSAVGFDIFGPSDRFPGDNLHGPENVNGILFGLVSEGNILDEGNAPVTGDNPLIHNSAIFTLNGIPQGFDASTGVSNVWFQYGSSLQQPSFPGNGNGNGYVIPEPLTMSALLLGVGGLAGYIRKRNRR